jgi:hypothetical protein
MAAGYSLTRLAVTGPGEPAIVEFGPGLNVIWGPSDTGKTFIFACIDFCLGAGEPPAEIRESTGYTAAELTLVGRQDGIQRVLSRPLQGGAVTLEVGGNTRSLGPKHKADDAMTVSGYLLELCGLQSRKLRTDASGKTRSMSFRDVARLTMIDEDTITGKHPPARTPHQRDRTVEDRAFRFFITGADDEAVVGDESPKTKKLQKKARAGLLRELLTAVERDQDSLSIRIDDSQLGEQHLAELDRQRSALSTQLEEARESAHRIETLRRPIWRDLRESEAQVEALTELESRFILLQAQYQSDVDRLEAAGEAAARLLELAEERCPICGATAEHHDRNHAPGLPTPQDVAAASRAESAKIIALAADLEAAIADNRADIAAAQTQKESVRERLSELDRRVEEVMRPRLAELSRTLRAIERERAEHARALDVARRRIELHGLLGSAESPVEPGAFSGTLAGPSAAEAEPFAKQVETVLRSWNYPSLDRVTFSDSTQDIVVSGQKRRNHGQGVRALMHSAFTLGLFRIVLDAGRGTPGVVLIDSPLVVYEEPDPEEEEFPAGVKDAFYRRISSDFRDAQVVIFENSAPPQGLDPSATVVHFTHASHGRFGFFPQSASRSRGERG